MREIRFRAWDKKDRKMSDVIGLDFRHGGITLLYKRKAIEFAGSAPLSDFELMQYTGLKDKNGKEIYEGDIVTYQGYPELPLSVASVEWNNERARFIIRWQDDQSHLGHDTFDRIEYLTSYEVIGNIYENPELLEVKNVRDKG